MIIQVLKTKVLKCDPEKMKMMLSFKAAVEGVTEANVKPPVECEVGKVSTGLFVARSFFFIFFFLTSIIQTKRLKKCIQRSI